MTAVLSATDISVSFGGVVACNGIDVELGSAEVIGLTGPNGSGKSTFLNALNGLVPATGSLTIDGTPVPLGRSRPVRDAGVIRTFQAPQNLAELSCLENVMLSTTDRARTGLLAAVLGRVGMHERERRRIDRALAALARVGLLDLASTLTSQLTYGQQRLVELARAIAGEPKVLLLDEPSAGLNAAETTGLADILTGLHADSISMIVIDHKIDFLDRLSDRIVVLQLGSVIAEGTPAEIWANQDVVDAYLGTRKRD